MANVTTPTEAWTVLQQGFYAPGDGGGATYQWSLTSTCTADGIICVLPIGQASVTPGRYLLQTLRHARRSPDWDAAGGMDNSPLLATLMAALGPSGFNYGGPSKFCFPAENGKAFTAYYFSQSFVISRVARFRCGNGSSGIAPASNWCSRRVCMGVIQEDAHSTSDGQYGGGTVDGCVIVSLGFGGGARSAGASTITAFQNQDPGGIIPATVWHVGDGIIGTPSEWVSDSRLRLSPLFSRGPISAP